MKMIRQGLLCVVLLGTLIATHAQEKSSTGIQKANMRFSDPDNLSPLPVGALGFPSRDAALDVLPGFQDPPAGYGEVPFWWWSGDKLDKDRLLWQIEELHQKGIPGMQVNYIHSDTSPWRTYMDDPQVFSDEWWDFWKFAADQCQKRGMGIGLSGYTIDWPKKDNLFNRIIYTISEIQGQELLADTVVECRGGSPVALQVSDNTIGVWAYPAENGKITGRGKDLASFLKNSMLRWRPGEGEWQVWVYTAERQSGTLNPMHPRSGKTVIEKFFQPFVEHAENKSADGLNYFFQDELLFGVGDRIWTEDFGEVFKKQKGYDVFELLPSMFTGMGDLTAKGRLDFLDVKVQLTEERYFKPIFDWHWSRGMIYGCDPEGRGREPGMYGDNFRAQRWYTAPGHDTPGGHADLIKGKVSSSIAALYKRPRVWLEGYHSLGWGATPERLFFATCENYLYGCNLLNLHGFYYTTHGSYWEWAPPCYHFRMPYWDHMGVFLKYFERLSYLLSQGVLQAPVAVMYPVSPVQAKMGGDEATQVAFDSGTELFNNGHDFVFMDDQSLMRAKIKAKALHVSDMDLEALVLPAMKAVRWSTIRQALAFFRKGGIVVAVGQLPDASDRAGSNDPLLDAAVKEMFGVSAGEMVAGKQPEKQVSRENGVGLFVPDVTTLKSEIDRLLPRDVKSDQPVRSLHRKIGPRDVYMIMGAAKGSFCTFRASGRAERWDPWTGETKPLEQTSAGMGESRIKMPLDTNEAQIIVFSPAERNGRTADETSMLLHNAQGHDNNFQQRTSSIRPLKNKLLTYEKPEDQNAPGASATVLLDGDWEFELKPTMDNRWGDFRLPATLQMIGAEARIFSYAQEPSEPAGWELPGFDDSEWARVTYGFGTKFRKLGPLPDSVNREELDRLLSSQKMPDFSKPVVIDGQSYTWKPYDFSWRWGMEGDPGHQGYHGLKENISDDFIGLGKPDKKFNETLYTKEEEGTCYYLWTSAFAEKSGRATFGMDGLKPEAIFLNHKKVDEVASYQQLKKGGNPLLLRYNKPGRGHFVVIGEETPGTGERTPLSMKWNDLKNRVAFDVLSEDKRPAGWYRFTAPPGLKAMTITTTGSIKAWIDGKPASVSQMTSGCPAQYRIVLDQSVPERSKVALRVEQARGDYGGSAFPEPVLLDCEAGISQTGDWSEGSALECYSGGAWYRKIVSLSKAQAASEVMLDLGEVVATAEVRINGKTAGVLVSPPWKLDLSADVREGENRLEILVYNTLANHYATIPTRYRGDSLKSGLIGPVRLEITPR